MAVFDFLKREKKDRCLPQFANMFGKKIMQYNLFCYPAFDTLWQNIYFMDIMYNHLLDWHQALYLVQTLDVNQQTHLQQQPTLTFHQHASLYIRTQRHNSDQHLAVNAWLNAASHESKVTNCDLLLKSGVGECGLFGFASLCMFLLL